MYNASYYPYPSLPIVIWRFCKTMKRFSLLASGISSTQLVLLVSIFLMIFCNNAFFHAVVSVYPLSLKNIPFIASLAVVFGCSIAFLLSLVCFKYTIKPIVVLLLLLSSLASYFMDSYQVIIDVTMIQNIVHSDLAEALDLLTLKMLLYFLFLGVLPGFLVYRVDLVFKSLRQELYARLKLLGVILALMGAMVAIFSGYYGTFFREHKPIRYYSNPLTYVYSLTKYASKNVKREGVVVREIGNDAKIPEEDTGRELILFVLGETARADRFSLNGYQRDTNPLLRKEDVISFSNVWSCGTSTAVSVPCMFSMYSQSDYDDAKAQATENVLDVLQKSGVNVLWLDNNSDSKGVAVRVPYQSYKSESTNEICDIECRDVGLLTHIQAYIQEHPTGDILIVLHQMGNHGPAYYKRYPVEFEKYTPSCQSNHLEACSQEEIDNAYDNAILYTDYFLSKVIDLLKINDSNFETAMFYVSDHGESLGEHGVYLHGMPTFIAPDSQLRVPVVMWFGQKFEDLDRPSLNRKINKKYTHDNVFHTLLGLMEIESEVYDQRLDIIHGPE